MVFSDLFFIFVFLPAFLLCYLIAVWLDKRSNSTTGLTSAPKRNAVLVAFSLIFYAWGEPVYVFLMLGSVLLNYFVGLLIDRQQHFRKTALAGGIILNLVLLGTFKYAGFFAQTLCDLGLPVSIPAIALPIGISFYTFQSISYLTDVYRRVAPAQKRLSGLLLYISMFPQLIAGPIVRYDIVAHDISQRTTTAHDLSEGAFRFLIGLGKKVILANQFSEIATQFLANSHHDLTMAGAWVGILAFTFQIFFDFSGYSDMAIGLGRCLGFRFAENFKHPYCCNSITAFWRRWHISLGSFFRDYVYIPLGGNRHHQALNILIVWFLTGMWHGASWNFIIWGLYFGLIVMIEKHTLLKVQHRIPAPLLHLYALLLVVIGWGIFYFDDMGRMGSFFTAFFGLQGEWNDFAAESALTANFWLWITAILFSMPVYDSITSLYTRVFPTSNVLSRSLSMLVRLALSIAILGMSVALLVGATNNAFIYTRF